MPEWSWCRGQAHEFSYSSYKLTASSSVFGRLPSCCFLWYIMSPPPELFAGFLFTSACCFYPAYPFISSAWVLAPSDLLKNLPHFVISPSTKIYCVFYCLLSYSFYFEDLYFLYSFTIILVRFPKEVEKHTYVQYVLFNQFAFIFSENF